jgi:hypothetical protein
MHTRPDPNTDLAAVVQQLLEDSAAKAPPPEEKDEAPGKFRFKLGHDDLGLRNESEHYVNPRCSQCYGKGYLSLLVGNGYKDGQARQARDLVPCNCVHKGYMKRRRDEERTIVRLAKAEKITVEEAYKRAVARAKK